MSGPLFAQKHTQRHTLSHTRRLGRDLSQKGLCLSVLLLCISLSFHTARADVVYSLTVHENLALLGVQIQNPKKQKLAADRVDFALFSNAQNCLGEPLTFASLATAECARYDVHLPRERLGRFAVAVPDDVRVIDPTRILLGGQNVKVNITPNSKISHPWLEIAPDIYAIPDSPRSSAPEIVIGHFHAIDVMGLHKPVAFIGAAQYRDKIRSWLGDVVAQLGGTESFPNPNVQVIIHSVVARGDSPVPFGHVIRNQGETVRFFVDPSRSLSSLQHDWTASHELAHLKLPYLAGSGRWLSEGFASYYQNVLQARLGFYSEVEAWRRLRRSFSRAQEAGADMSPNQSTRAPFWEARMMIYWSGAALALLADVELRKLGKTLDAELAKLDTPQPRSWRPRELMNHLDALSGTNVFTTLYNRHADTVGMPDVEETFIALGVSASGRVDNDAPLAALRRDIMSAQ